MTNKKKIMMKALIVAVMFFGCLLLLTGRVANILAILLCLGCIEWKDFKKRIIKRIGF